MWSILKKLQGHQEKNEDKALNTSSGTKLTKRSKANAFRAEYAHVSRKRTHKTDRWIRKNNNDRIKQKEATIKQYTNFTINELLNAIKKTNEHKAAGSDKLHPRFLKNLGPGMQDAILHLFNTSWKSATVPQQWRRADIRPILKRGKDPSLVSFTGPSVSLPVSEN